MRKTPRVIALSLTAAALCFGSVSCAAPEASDANTQEQLKDRNAGEAKKALDGFFTSVSWETKELLKPENAANAESGASGSEEDVAAANLDRIKKGYPSSYGYVNDGMLGTNGAVKLIATYANPAAVSPGLVIESTESDFKLDGDMARVSGSDLEVKPAEGKTSDFRAGDITLTFANGQWKITDFSVPVVAEKSSL